LKQSIGEELQTSNIKPATTFRRNIMDLEGSLFIFVLATLIGLEVIRRVSPLLHTPLMSLTNAISAIAVIAAIQVTAEEPTFAKVLGTIAVAAATANIVGGFWITDRMLKMFKQRGPGKP
jgi:NAD(P) transhydrogenase subunit alpha